MIIMLWFSAGAGTSQKQGITKRWIEANASQTIGQKLCSAVPSKKRLDFSQEGNLWYNFLTFILKYIQVVSTILSF